MSHPHFASFRHRATKTLSTLLLCMALPAGAFASTDVTPHGSLSLSAVATISTIGASAETLASVPQLSVAGVELSSEGAVWLLRGIAKGSGEAVELSVTVAGGASLAVGTSLEVITSTAGSLLVASGEALAFIPNELGASLYYSETWDEAKP